MPHFMLCKLHLLWCQLEPYMVCFCKHLMLLFVLFCQSIINQQVYKPTLSVLYNDAPFVNILNFFVVIIYSQVKWNIQLLFLISVVNKLLQQQMLDNHNGNAQDREGIIKTSCSYQTNAPSDWAAWITRFILWIIQCFFLKLNKLSVCYVYGVYVYWCRLYSVGCIRQLNQRAKTITWQNKTKTT